MSIRDTDYPAYLTALRTELDAGHPSTGAYSADDAIAAGQINDLNRTVSIARDRVDLWEEFLTLGSGVLARLVDDAKNEDVGETDLTPNGFTRHIRYERSRLNPSTAEFIGSFQGNLAAGAPAINMQAEPYDSMLTQMADVENTIGSGAAAGIRALCDETVSRAVELWGCDTVDTSTGTVLEVRENVITTDVDVTQARAL